VPPSVEEEGSLCREVMKSRGLCARPNGPEVSVGTSISRAESINHRLFLSVKIDTYLGIRQIYPNFELKLVLRMLENI
jgi:hypothetical protein